MAATILQIADAVVEQLNTASLSQTFEAVRLYRPQFELPEMNTLHVSVVPKDEESKPLSRKHLKFTYRVDVGVQKKFQKGDAAELDPLVALVEEIAELLRGQSLGDAICMVTKPSPIYSLEHMEQLRQFTSVLTLSFEVIRT